MSRENYTGNREEHGLAERNEILTQKLNLAQKRVEELERKEAALASANASMLTHRKALDEILKQTDWAYYTIKDKLLFGLDEAQAVYARERRVFGVMITTRNKIRELLK